MDKNLATRLKELRSSHGLSQKSLGEHIGLSMQAINNIERGYRTTTSEKLTLLADYFGVSIDYLVGRTDDPGSAVASHSSEALSPDDKELLELYHQLNGQAKGQLQARARDLLQRQHGLPAEPAIFQSKRAK